MYRSGNHIHIFQSFSGTLISFGDVKSRMRSSAYYIALHNLLARVDLHFLIESEKNGSNVETRKQIIEIGERQPPFTHPI